MDSKFQDYSIQISTPDQFTPIEDRLGKADHTWHGAAIMWHESLNSEVVNISNSNDRFTGINLFSRGLPVLAISLYLPTSGRDDEFLDCRNKLSIFIQENSTGEGITLIGTDSNCSEKSSPRRIQSFHKFCKEQNLLKFCQAEPTFHHSNGLSSSNIDYFLISQKHALKLSNIGIECNQEHSENFSSHEPVSANLKVVCPDQSTNQEKYTHTYTDFEQPRIIWDEKYLESYQNTSDKVLQDYESLFNSPEFIPLKCQLYSDLLVKSAELCFPRKSNPPAVRKSRPPPKVHQAWKHLDKCFKIWKKEGKVKTTNSVSYTRYKQARANF